MRVQGMAQGRATTQRGAHHAQGRLTARSCGARVSMHARCHGCRVCLDADDLLTPRSCNAGVSLHAICHGCRRCLDADDVLTLQSGARVNMHAIWLSWLQRVS